jgi:protein O-GlcNAc transferase
MTSSNKRALTDLSHNLQAANEELQHGIRLQAQGFFAEAYTVYRRLVQFHPKNTALYNRLGQVTFSLGNLTESAEHFTHSLSLSDTQDEVWANLGVINRRLKNYDRALVCQNKAIELNPKNANAFNNLGILFDEGLRRQDEALVAFDHAIALNPDMADPHFNKGNIYRLQSKFEDAIACYEKAIALNPQFGAAFTNLAITYSAQKNYPKALEYFQVAVDLDQRTHFIFGQFLYTRLHVAVWGDYDQLLARLITGIVAREPITAPFPAHALLDNPKLQQQVVKTLVALDYPPRDDLPKPDTHPEHHRIRVGYFSSDYWHHPVTHLMLGLFNAHDRKRFEVIAFSLGTPPKDSWHQRVKDACDQFIDVNGLSDVEVAKLAREMEIDIAVDLNGFTENRRTGIFAYRAAPVQVSYIGFLGSMGTPYIDYLISDQTIIPAQYRKYYTEKILYLPSFQCNDPLQKPSDKVMTRDDFGLPKDGFVYCCFNNNFKITPSVFACWMRILAQVPKSVLWLYINNDVARVNLQNAASRHGISPERLVFAGKIPLEDHLARQKLADLFLDTLPYNAGATASNALRVGLPVLTQTGHAFAGRMGTSLLKAVGLSELAVADQNAYEAMALRLAREPALLNRIREKLLKNLAHAPLFDNQSFATHIETGFETMHQRACQDLPPVHILVQ